MCGKTKNSLNKKIFRQINSLVFSLVKRSFHEIFAKKRVGAQCGNFGNLLSQFFDKNFVKVTVLLKKLLDLTKFSSGERE